MAAGTSATAPVLDWFLDNDDGLAEKAPAYNLAVMNYLRSASAREAIEHVILAARWRGYCKRAENIEPLRDALAQTVGELQKLGYSVTIFKEVPTWTSEVPKALKLPI